MNFRMFVPGAIFGAVVGAVAPVAAQFHQIYNHIYGLPPGQPHGFVCVKSDGMTVRPNVSPYPPVAETYTREGVTFGVVIVVCPS